MEAVFSYIIGLGAAVMMPIIFTILGVCIGIKFSKALKSGLYVGVGFVGLSIITALLVDTMSPALGKVVEIYDLKLQVFDMGWPAAASVAYNTLVGSFIIPVCLGVNLVLLLTGCTRTVNIDLWNYWHFAFIGAVVYFMTDSIAWGFFAAIICYILTLVMADMTAKRFQKFYPGMDGISIPQPFCQGFMPFAIVINKALDYVPGINKVNIDSEGMKKKFGLFGEPLFLGVLIGIIIGCLACKDGAHPTHHLTLHRGPEAYRRGYKGAYRKEVWRGQGTLHRYVTSPCHRSSYHIGSVTAPHPCNTGTRRCSSWQPVPAFGITRRYVLRIRNGIAIHQRQCAPLIHRRSCGNGDRSVLRDMDGRRLHFCCPQRSTGSS